MLPCSSSIAREQYTDCALRNQAIQQGHADIAKIYAQNAIRKQNEKVNLLRLGSRLDAVSSRVQTAVTMRSVTGSMTNVVKGMDTAMKSMDLEKVGNLEAMIKNTSQQALTRILICRSAQSWTASRRNSRTWTSRLDTTRTRLRLPPLLRHRKMRWTS